MDKVYIGKKMSDLDVGEKSTKISRVNILVDDEHQYTAGDDSGRTLEKTVPWGSQEMANSILAAIKNYEYQPFAGTEAIVDPAAEIGDAVTVGGVYSVLVQKDISNGKLTTMDISAPSTDEIEDEYPYQSRQLRQQQREVAQTRSMITKSADAITQLVEAVDGRVTEVVTDVTGIHTSITALDGRTTNVETTIDGITVSGEDGTTYIKPGAIQADSITGSMIKGGTITADDIQAGSITASCLSFAVYDQAQTNAQITSQIAALKNGLELTVENNKTGTAATLRLMDGSIELDSANINLTGLVTVEALQTSGGGVTINGDNITAGTIKGEYIDGKNLNIAEKFVVDSYGNITIKNCSITLQDSSITSGMLKDDSVTTSKINDGAVNADCIASDAVTSTKIAAKAVTAKKIDARGLSIGPEGGPAQFWVEQNGNVHIGGSVSIGGTISWSQVTGTSGLTNDISTAKSDASTAKTDASTANTDLKALAKGTYTKAGTAGTTFISGKIISSAEIRGAEFKDLDGNGVFSIDVDENNMATFEIGRVGGSNSIKIMNDGLGTMIKGPRLQIYGNYSSARGSQGTITLGSTTIITYIERAGEYSGVSLSGGTWDFSNVNVKGLDNLNVTAKFG